jgi:hypothetical protein
MLLKYGESHKDDYHDGVGIRIRYCIAYNRFELLIWKIVTCLLKI